MSEMLQPSDKAALASLEKKLHLVRDHVTAVARGYNAGYYLYGTGGLGKSHTVLRHLRPAARSICACSRRRFRPTSSSRPTPPSRIGRT